MDTRGAYRSLSFARPAAPGVKSIRVAALTSSRNDPSSRFRIRQFLAPLKEFNILATEFCPLIGKYAPALIQLTGLPLVSRLCGVAAARSYDVTWLNRELVTGHDTLERFAGRRVLFDVDDAIWLSGRRDFARRIAGRAAGVVAGNQTIADYFRSHARRVWIVPASVNTNTWKPAGCTHSELWTIGWSGTRWNLKYLYRIEKPLKSFLTDHPASRLLVVCDRPPEFRHLQAHQWSFLRWSPQNEVKAVQQMDAGIMPLDDNEWTRAKCALKMLCCLSVEVPTIVSPVGAAAEILRAGPVPCGFAALTGDDWYEHLHSLYHDRLLGKSMGIAGRKIVAGQYSVERSTGLLARIFTEVADS